MQRKDDIQLRHFSVKQQQKKEQKLINMDNSTYLCECSVDFFSKSVAQFSIVRFDTETTKKLQFLGCKFGMINLDPCTSSCKYLIQQRMSFVISEK